MPIHQLEGFTRGLHKLVPALPPGDYSGLRKRILSLPVDPYRDLRETNEPVSIAVDSTGIKVQKAGGWIERKHGKKRKYIKLHFAVNTVTHEVVAMEVSTDDTHDVKALPGLFEAADGRVPVLFGVSHSGTELAIRLARHAEDRGADGVIAMVPYFSHTPSKAIVENHIGAICGATSLPVMLQDAEDATTLSETCAKKVQSAIDEILKIITSFT